MERFEFTEEYHLGLPDIDAQHARLFDLFNSLIEVEKRGAAREEICLVVDELVDYIDVHFKYEEWALHDCAYDNLEEHRAKHADFVRQTIDFDKAFRHHGEDLSWEILYFLRQWLVDHILVEDRQYVEAMKGARV